MNIYLASRYSRHPEMQEVAEDIRARGYTVTSRWINGSHDIEDADDPSARERFAIEDFEDLTKSDVVISFTESERVGRGRGGRHVEFGIALALNKRVVLIGPRENVFHYFPVVEVYESLEDFWATEGEQ